MRVRVCEERGGRWPLATPPRSRGAARAAAAPAVEAEASDRGGGRSGDVRHRQGWSSNARAGAPNSDPCAGSTGVPSAGEYRGGAGGCGARTADAEDEGRAHHERQRPSDLWIPPEPCVDGRGQILKTFEVRRGVGQQPLQARAQHLLQARAQRVGGLLEAGLVDVISR
eukprot:scaffold83211_cov63-Phaeocystis_antarctica.AAC.4